MSLFPSIFYFLYDYYYCSFLCMDYRVRRTFSPSGWCFSTQHVVCFIVFSLSFIWRCRFFRVFFFLYDYYCSFLCMDYRVRRTFSPSGWCFSTQHVCFFVFSLLFIWRCRFFRVFFFFFVRLLLLQFSLYGEYVVRFPLPDSVFLPCDHGLDF